MIITIAGLPGAGKTSVAKELAKRLVCDFVSVGEIRGQVAIERGITIDELNDLGTESDMMADAKQVEIAKNKNDIVIEGRISWHLIPNSFKILVVVDPTEGARRIFEEQRSGDGARADERTYASVEDTEQSIKNRVENDRRRMQALYGVENFIDPKHFDFVLDTTNASGPVENADKIVAVLKAKNLIK